MVGNRLSQFRLPNQEREVSHEANGWNCIQCCPGTCQLWPDCDQAVFGKEIDPVVSFRIVDQVTLYAIAL